MPVHVPRFDEGTTLPVGPEVPVGMFVLHGDVQKRWDGAAWQEVPLARDVALYATGARQVVRTWQLESAALGAVERFDGWTGEAFLTGQDDVASVTGDVTVTRGSSLSDGALSITVDPLAGLNIGDPFMDGYFAGIIDTTQGNIIAADASQVGLRYALIVAPKSLEASADLQWKTGQSAGPAATRTRWDGLSATEAMAADAATYPAADYCAGLSYPADGGSPWYLGAMDELEVLYRNFKATTEANSVVAEGGHEFPGGSQDPGYNPSSDPVGAVYTSTVPGQTSVLAFQSGGSQALENVGYYTYYWSSTEYNATKAWMQLVSGTSAVGYQIGAAKRDSYFRVRPVRRFVL